MAGLSDMKYPVFFFLFLFVFARAGAQKPFSEGVIVYRVVLKSADKELRGTYIFTIKGAEIKKELKLENGYNDIMLLNCSTGDVYSLQSKDGKKYAIQLSMNDMVKKQDKYVGFTLSNETPGARVIAGIAASRANLTYRNGSVLELYYTKDWSPAQPVTYERFPDPKFLPLSFSYTEDNGMTLSFEAEKVEAGPVENAVFRISPDHKMISYKEYKAMGQ